MHLHAVVGSGKGKLAVRTTTCACRDCFGESFNTKSACKWEECHMEERKTKSNRTCDDVTIGIEIPEATDRPETSANGLLDLAIGNFVIAKYEDVSYVGKIVEICEDDNTVHINFMSSCGKVQGGSSGLLLKTRYGSTRVKSYA